MVKIECLACGKSVKIPQYINAEKYDGELVCQECKSLLHVKLVKEKVEKYKIVENKSKEEFNFTKLVLERNKQETEK